MERLMGRFWRKDGVDFVQSDRRGLVRVLLKGVGSEDRGCVS